MTNWSGSENFVGQKVSLLTDCWKHFYPRVCRTFPTLYRAQTQTPCFQNLILERCQISQLLHLSNYSYLHGKFFLPFPILVKSELQWKMWKKNLIFKSTINRWMHYYMIMFFSFFLYVQAVPVATKFYHAWH